MTCLAKSIQNHTFCVCQSSLVVVGCHVLLSCRSCRYGQNYIDTLACGHPLMVPLVLLTEEEGDGGVEGSHAAVEPSLAMSIMLGVVYFILFPSPFIRSSLKATHTCT